MVRRGHEWSAILLREGTTISTKPCPWATNGKQYFLGNVQNLREETLAYTHCQSSMVPPRSRYGTARKTLGIEARSIECNDHFAMGADCIGRKS